MSVFEERKAQAAAITREFPGWDAWVGTDSLWHARRIGSVNGPGDILTGEDDEDIRDEIRASIEERDGA